jgi:hypothetical protein
MKNQGTATAESMTGRESTGYKKGPLPPTDIPDEAFKKAI